MAGPKYARIHAPSTHTPTKFADLSNHLQMMCSLYCGTAHDSTCLHTEKGIRREAVASEPEFLNF